MNPVTKSKQKRLAHNRLDIKNGHKFGNMEVVKETEKSISGHRRFICLCVCGNEFNANLQDLKNGKVKNCKTCRYQKTSDSNKKHGQNCSSKREGTTKVYMTWQRMKARCYNKSNPAYKYYGARGIVMQQNWINDFQKFADYIGDPPTPLHSIDRIDNDKGYFEGNVRWVLPDSQSRNRRTITKITINNVSMCLKDWCRELNISYSSVRKRIYRGMTYIQALGVKE